MRIQNPHLKRDIIYDQGVTWRSRLRSEERGAARLCVRLNPKCPNACNHPSLGPGPGKRPPWGPGNLNYYYQIIVSILNYYR